MHSFYTMSKLERIGFFWQSRINNLTWEAWLCDPSSICWLNSGKVIS